MEEVKKMKLEEGTWNGETDSNNSPQAIEELRSLLDPLPKPQLVDLLAMLGSQYPSIAEEIKNVARANLASETLCAMSAGKSEKRSTISDGSEMDNKTGTQIKEALEMQLQVQRRLHEQLEIQRKLQMRIEEQAKQLKMIFDQQQKKQPGVC